MVQLYFLPKNMTMHGDRYIGVLKDHLLDMVTINGCTTIMKTLSYSKENYEMAVWKDVMEWPWNSPDLTWEQEDGMSHLIDSTSPETNKVKCELYLSQFFYIQYNPLRRNLWIKVCPWKIMQSNDGKIHYITYQNVVQYLSKRSYFYVHQQSW